MVLTVLFARDPDRQTGESVQRLQSPAAKHKYLVKNTTNSVYNDKFFVLKKNHNKTKKYFSVNIECLV